MIFFFFLKKHLHLKKLDEVGYFPSFFFLISIYFFGRAGSLLWRMGPLVVADGLSCPTACGILVPRSRIEPTSPALRGEFLNTGPLGKSQDSLLLKTISKATKKLSFTK